MDVIYAMRMLRRRWIWVVIGLIPAAFLAVSTVYTVNTSGLHKTSIEYGAAQTTLMVDSPDSTLASANSDVSGLSQRAQVFAQFMQTAPVAADIARRAHLDTGEIAISSPNTSSGFVASIPTGGSGNTGLLQESKAYQLLAVPQPNLPLIVVFAQGPNGTAAVRLANAAAAALQAYVGSLKVATPTEAERIAAARQGSPPPSRVNVDQLGSAHGGMVTSGTSSKIAALVFVGLVFVDCLLVILIGRFVDRLRLEREFADTSAAAHENEVADPVLAH